MDKTLEGIIERIVHIPHDFNYMDKSELTLLQESGYFGMNQQITEDRIKQVLRKYPNIIADWLQLSDDSRSSIKWYFTKGNDGKYFVGHWPEGEEFKEINSSDEFYACAAFIKRHIEKIRILFKK